MGEGERVSTFRDHMHSVLSIQFQADDSDLLGSAPPKEKILAGNRARKRNSDCRAQETQLSTGVERLLAEDELGPIPLHDARALQ